MIKLSTISEAAKLLGVSVPTIRRWEKAGKIVAAERTVGNQRRYDLSKLKQTLSRSPINILNTPLKTYAYARVSSHDQKPDLERQKNLLEMYCASQGWSFEIIADLGSGMNYHKRGLKKLLHLIVEEQVGRLVLTHKDRLLRFGAELVFGLCELKGVEVVLINQGADISFEEELAQDVLEIITVFSARLYGARSRKNKTLINDLQKVLENHHA